MHFDATDDFDGACGRVQALVRAHFGNSQNQAAAAWGLSQGTLSRFLSRKTKIPRADFFQKIAAYHGLTIDGLITGQAAAPALPSEPREEAREWRQIVRALKLSKRGERAALLLPRTTGRAFRILTLMGLKTTMPRGEEMARYNVDSGMAAAAWQAARLEYSAWITLLKGLIDAYGPVNVGRKLEGEWSLVALGFQGLALYMVREEKLSRSTIESEFSKHAPEDPKLDPRIEQTIEYMANSPHVPPLEQLRFTEGRALWLGE